MIAATLDDPAGYGRVVRNAAGDVERIVEHKDATEEERAIREINTGIYVFDMALLFDALRKITPDNAQGEYYLTDVLAVLRVSGKRVAAIVTAPTTEAPAGPAGTGSRGRAIATPRRRWRARRRSSASWASSRR